MLRNAGLIFGFILVHTFCWPQSSVFSSGAWFKIGIEERNVYRLDYAFLSEAGVPVSSIDPNTFQLFGNGLSGPLPQPNSTSRPLGLQEVAIEVVGAEDQTFDPGDYLLFYGKDPDKVTFVDERFHYENNPYSDQVFYFLTFGQDVGRRILAEALEVGNTTEANTYSYSIHDLNTFNLLNSGRQWFGEDFDKPGRTRNVDFKLPALTRKADMQVTAMASAMRPSHFEITVNGDLVGELEIPERPNADSPSKAFFETTEMDLSVDQRELSIALTYQSADNDGFGFLDHILINTNAPLTWEGEPHFFAVPYATTGQEVFIENYQQALRVWQVTDLLGVQEVSISPAGSFLVDAGQSQKYILFKAPSEELTSFEAIPNQDLLSLSTPELLILTHQLFQPEAEMLAAHRRTHSGITTKIVTVDQVYNDFSSGAQDVTAIRDFIRHLGDGLRFVLLFGDASYDYKDRVADNSNFVPTYQSRNALNSVFTYCSDDYFTFMEDHEGFWAENNDDDHTMDLAIGRLPVRDVEQARIIVEKIIDYETSSPFGDWRTKMLFMADDGDDNLHHDEAEYLATRMEDDYDQVQVDKLYLDAYPQKGQYSEQAVSALDRKVHEGRLVMDYSGHGNELQLTAENLVSDFSINSWTNRDVLPFLATSTCDFGVFDNPDWYSSGERLLFHEEGGAIGLMSATRVVFASSNIAVNSAFTEQIFRKEGERYQTIGEIFRRLKNNSLRGRNNRNYALLADPSMRLLYPKHEVVLDSICDANGTPIDGLVSHQPLTLHGSVHAVSGMLDTFSGQVALKIDDDARRLETLGDQNEPYSYADRSSILFSGKAVVTDGIFELEVLLPEGINGAVMDARLLFYAMDTTLEVDASGGLNARSIPMSGTQLTDSDPPEVKVFIGDTLFKEGDQVSSNATLIVQVRDETGVDLSLSDPERSFRMVLKDEEILLNAYYQTAFNTYQKGEARYTFRNLETGEHEIEIFVSDLAGNLTRKSVHFEVVDARKIVLNDIRVFPNPSAGDVTFSFRHDRASEELQVGLQVITLSGVKKYEKTLQLTGAPDGIEKLIWLQQDQEVAGFQGGLYIYRLIVESVVDGSAQQIVGRLLLR